MADSRGAHWGRLIAATIVVIAGGFTLRHVLPTPDLRENRRLAPAPAWPTDASDLTAFREASGAYVADHFPARTQLIGALNRLRMMFGASGSPRVLVGRDGWLFSDDGSHLGAARGEPPLNEVETHAWLSALAGRSEAMRAESRSYVLLVAPLKETVYPDQAPSWFALDLNRPAATLARLASASGAGEAVYPHEALERERRWGLHVYDRYDTHWTGLGAYHGYVAFMRSLQRRGLAEGPRPLDAFTERTERDVRAIPRDLALMLGVSSFVTPDYPQVEDLSVARTLRVTYLGARRDWTGLHMIETGQAGKPVLLITVDSFSNALMPFLYSHFSRIIVAHNQDGFWRRDLIDRFHPDVVATEVVETGVRFAMQGSPSASPQAEARIATVVEQRKRYLAVPREVAYLGRRRMIEGGDGPDLLKGTRGHDDIQGRPGDDTIPGGAGDDVLRGGRGRDSLDGGPGADWISGGRDDDILRGGRGADVFDSFAGAGTDTVLDFNAQEGDRVEIDADVPYTVRQAGPDTIVEMNGARLILRGATMTELPLGWIRNR